MKPGLTLLIIIAVITVLPCSAQTFLKGKVVDDLYDRVVIGATVKNKRTNSISQSDMGGNYKISATAGDVILFSSIGYSHDSITVTDDMLLGPFDIALTRNVVLLEEIQVGQLNPYQMDSLARREEYDSLLNVTTSKVIGGRNNTLSDGVGISISPISHFSRKEKNLRRFQRNFEEYEKEYYIDYKFSFNYVAKVTQMKGDSLRQFILQYRPGYEFCRRNSFDQMLVYINDSYREYLNKNTPEAERNNSKRKKKTP